MKIGLLDVDSHNFPNLCLMKISAYHKNRGDEVEMLNGFMHYDKVYASKVFDDTYSPDYPYPIYADEVVKGGTGYGLTNTLPDEIEHIMPDYSLYNIQDKAYGFLTRGCPRGCEFCIVADKEGRKSKQVADLTDFWGGQNEIILLDPNLLASDNAEELLQKLIDTNAKIDFNQGLDARLLTEDRIKLLEKVKARMFHFAWDNPDDEIAPKKLEMLARHKMFNKTNTAVYILTNFNSTEEQDLERIYRVRDMGLSPYMMIYDRPNASRRIRKMARWVNNRWIFNACDKWEDYFGNDIH